jgi:hypothetical protein
MRDAGRRLAFRPAAFLYPPNRFLKTAGLPPYSQSALSRSSATRCDRLSDRCRRTNGITPVRLRSSPGARDRCDGFRRRTEGIAEHLHQRSVLLAERPSHRPLAPPSRWDKAGTVRRIGARLPHTVTTATPFRYRAEQHSSRLASHALDPATPGPVSAPCGVGLVSASRRSPAFAAGPEPPRHTADVPALTVSSAFGELVNSARAFWRVAKKSDLPRRRPARPEFRPSRKCAKRPRLPSPQRRSPPPQLGVLQDPLPAAAGACSVTPGGR